MSIQIDIFRPYADRATYHRLSSVDPESRRCTMKTYMTRMLLGDPPGTFALVLRIDGNEETIVERWRVDGNGRILRARFCDLEPELEQV